MELSQRVKESKLVMLRSVQPWFMLGSKHCNTLVTSNSELTSHFYSFEFNGSYDLTNTAIPDGCIDILFDCSSDTPRAYLCGTTLEASEADFIHGHNYFGVRFRPGVIPGFVNLLPQELISNRLNLNDVISNITTIIEKVVSNDNFLERSKIVSSFILQTKNRPNSYLTSDIIEYIIKSNGSIQIRDLAAITRCSERTLQRRFRDDLGLTPKAFCRIIRCQSALYRINHGENINLSELAFELGFSDQAHFQREFKKSINETPYGYKIKTTSII